MATAVYKVNYQGLRKRESYDEIVDYLENKQEKVSYPNRFAKQIRNSPQLSNLLDGEGMGAVEMEEQQQKAMEHEQAEQAVRQAGGTAQVLRSAASQTSKPAIRVGSSQTNNPKMASTGSQAWKPNVSSGGTQTQIFDITLDDDIASMADDIQAVSDQQAQQVEQRRENITRILQSHLGNEVTPGNLDFAHQMAQQSASSSSTQPMTVDRTDPTKRNPESEHEPKGKVGRPRKTQQSDAPPEPMLEDGKQQKRQTSGNGNGNGKERAKPKRKAQKEQGMEALQAPEDTTNQAEGDTGASSSSAAKPKKTIKKDKPSHDTTKDTNANPKYWGRQNVGYLIDQLQQHHGVRFTKEQLKGRSKLKKQELIDMIKGKLGI
jgi:hypothetical protein